MEAKQKTAREHIDELMGNQCQCGRSKQPRMTFCRRCYFRLPQAMRHALYQPVGGGYAQAYQAASDYLRHERSRELSQEERFAR